MWQPFSTAPFNQDLELAVIDEEGEAHVLVFPCRRVQGGWIDAKSLEPVKVRPTHWREWSRKA